ncbi:hypothetical protein [Oligoflexus tunisiensis]|uniref:hypothetical protein n=1 Tax=Oligoflexus tunisiensis TaxID=708132 RepID=UPI00114CA850|nr:hypothetical protein [Oligoflexus tunisiensis]
MLLRFRSLILPVLASLLFIGVLLKTNDQRLKTLRNEYDIFAAPPLSQFSSGVIAVLTLGHKGIYDDFINIWLLQTLLDPRKGDDAEGMMRQIRSVIRHHPKLETTYMLSCIVMMQDFKRPEHCQEIILAGLKAFPMSWRLPMTQGYVEYFEMKQPAQAASFFMMAASRPHSPEYVQNTVKKLLREKDLTPEDLKRSLEIIAETESSDTFLKLLQSFGKAPALPEAPASP